jgi:hypothetical protein
MFASATACFAKTGSSPLRLAILHLADGSLSCRARNPPIPLAAVATTSLEPLAWASRPIGLLRAYDDNQSTPTIGQEAQMAATAVEVSGG